MRYRLLYLFCFCSFFSFSQVKDSVATPQNVTTDKLTLKKMILPASFITAGLVLRTPAWRDDMVEFKNKVFGTDFNFRGDDYFQFVPVAQTLLGNSLGFKSKHGYAQMVTNQLMSNIMMSGIVYSIKISVKDKRPDDSAHNSFPSGHTATAFNSAMINYLEFKDSSKWYACSGFLFATATGVLRVANNRHSPGDVFAGAGIGMATALVVHYWSPFRWDEKQKNKKLSYIIYPAINNSSYGIGYIANFK